MSFPTVRTLIHSRNVTCHGYRRSDNLWEIEARMTDTKGYSVHNDYRTVDAGAPFHDMAISVTVDDSLLIHSVEASIAAGPHRICPSVTSNFQRLVGLRICAGYTAELRRRLGGVHGCTHLVELFAPLATTAIQTVQPLSSAFPLDDVDARPPQIDSCHALAASGEVVAKYWPRFHRQTHEGSIS